VVRVVRCIEVVGGVRRVGGGWGYDRCLDWLLVLVVMEEMRVWDVVA
jgi:hypothetical protein